MKSKPRFHLSLVAQVSLLSFVITAAIAIALGYLLQQRLTENALEQEAKSAVDQVEFVVAPNLTADDFAGLSPERFAMFDALIRNRIIGMHIVRIKIWNAQGMLIYSDEKNLIGQTFPISDELREALAGETAMDVSALTKPENVSERGKQPRLFEIYVPIRPRDSDKVLGAYEIYHDLELLEPQLDALRRLIFTALGIGFLALYVSLFLIVRGASRELVRRNAENRELYALEQRRSRQLRAINEMGRQLSSVLDPDYLLDEILRLILERFSYDRGLIYLLRNEELVPLKARGFQRGWMEHSETIKRAVSHEGMIGQAAASGKCIAIGDVNIDSRWKLRDIDTLTRSAVAVPMIARSRVNGVILIASNALHAFEASDLAVLELIAAQAGIAIENAQLYESERRNVRKLNALRTIDHAISATLELERTLGVLIDKAIEHLGQSDAAGFVALVDRASDALRLAATKNLSDAFAQRFVLQVGESIAGRVVRDGVPRVVTHLATDPRTKFQDLRESEKLESAIAAPMRAEGRIVGVLGIYTRQPHQFSDEEMDFFVTLGGQAAIAVQNAQLYEQTKNQATSLAQLARQLEESYMATLSAMCAALDARDRETEGHSQRVADLTIKLAEAFGIHDEKSLRAIRYGALLHDVGKIGVSDAVLLKADELNPAEWVEMRQHPELGAAMLRGITFLEDAIPIVLHHQERWDGSGYPNGLKGEDIPLPARIFSVVDVYDALTSDRPYRRAFTHQHALAQIRSKSGAWFDPQVVSKFIEIVSG